MRETTTERGQVRVAYLLGGSALDRQAYRLLLSSVVDCEQTVDSDFAPTSVWAAMRAQPDLVLAETDTPRVEAIDALEMIRRLRPETRLVVISGAREPAEVEAWACVHLHGFVAKAGGVEELRAALRMVCCGREYFSAGLRRLLLRARDRREGAGRLSRREAELLPLLARGMTLRDAAAAMTISYKTADTYRTSLLRKLGVHDRVELARYAIRRGIISP